MKHFPVQPDDRRVIKVRISAATDPLVRRGAILLEDALRTAGVSGDGGGRILLFRRISAGRIRAAQSPASLSVFLEEQFRSAARLAVHASAPSAATANAVYFSDPVEPYCLAIEALANGEPLDDWFWRLALPEISPGAARRETLLAYSRQLATTEAGPAAVVSLLDFLVHRGLLLRFTDSLTPDDGVRLMALLGLAHDAPSQSAAEPFTSATPRASAPEDRKPLVAAPAGPLPRIAAVWHRTLRTCILHWGPEDTRSVWLAAAALAASSPSRVTEPALARSAAQLAAAIHARVETELRAASGFTRLDDNAPSQASPPHMPAPNPGASDRDDQVPSITAPPRTSVETPDFLGQAPAPLDRVFTRYAGLYFLLPVLVRLDLPLHLEEAFDPGLPERILWHAAIHLRLPADDPVLLPLGPAPQLDDRSQQWLRSARIWCVHRARVSIRSLVRRSGVISWSRTHLDLSFPIQSADIRIRKAGLDIDPGWLPWFGRVVRFHYGNGV